VGGKTLLLLNWFQGAGQWMRILLLGNAAEKMVKRWLLGRVVECWEI
jgi:hypothetical protein